MIRSALLWMAALVALAHCSPAPSTVPLGEGPLAVAEAERNAEARALERERLFAEARAGASKEPDRPAPPPLEAPAKPKTPGAKTGSGSHAKTNDHATADGGAPSGPGGVAAFLGDYRGEDSSVYVLEGLPDRTETDPNAHTRVDEDDHDHDHVGIALVDSSNGKDICVLRAEVKGTRAIIEPGLPCFEQSTPNVDVGAKVESGTATIEGDRLVVDMALSMEMQFGDRSTQGTLRYHFAGTRQ